MFEALTGSGFLAARRTLRWRAAEPLQTCSGPITAAYKQFALDAADCLLKAGLRRDLTRRWAAARERIAFTAAEKDGSINTLRKLSKTRAQAASNLIGGLGTPYKDARVRTKPVSLRISPCARCAARFFFTTAPESPKKPSESLVTRLSSAATDAAARRDSRNRF